jgi:tetratricopeptide (TPR) repeat protein
MDEGTAALVGDLRRLSKGGDTEAADDLLTSVVMAQFEAGHAVEADAMFRDLVKWAPDASLSATRRGYRLNTRGLLARGTNQEELGERLFLRALGVSKRHNDLELRALASLNLGTLAHRGGRDADAVRWYGEAAAAARAAGDPVTAIKCVFNLATIEVERGSVERAEALVEEAKTVARASGLRLGPQWTGVEGHVRRLRGDLTGAQTAYRDALAGSRRDQNVGLENIALQWLGASLVEDGQVGLAMRYLRRAVSYALLRRAPVALDPSSRALAHALHRLGRTRESASVLRSAHLALQEMSAPVGSAHVGVDLALLEAESGRHTEASQLLLDSIPILARAGDGSGRDEAVRALVEVACDSGDVGQLATAGRAVTSEIPRSDRRFRADLLDRIARGYAVLLSPEARSAFEASLDEARRGQLSDLAMRAARAAREMEDVGQMDSALRLFRRARRAASSRHDGAALTNILNDTGTLLARIGRLPESTRCLVASAELASQRQDKVARARAEFNLAEVSTRRGRLSEAMGRAEAALALTIETADSAAEAESRAQVGHILAALGRPQEARTAYQLALGVAKAAGSRAAEYSARSGMGGLYFESKRYLQAAAQYRLAAKYSIDDDPVHHVEALAGVFESYCAAQSSIRIGPAMQSLVSASQTYRQELHAADALFRGARWWLASDTDAAASIAATGIVLAGTTVRYEDTSNEAFTDALGHAGVWIGMLANSSVAGPAKFIRRVVVYLNRRYKGTGSKLEPMLSDMARQTANLSPLPRAAN